MNKTDLKHIVEFEDVGQRLDTYLSNIYSDFSRSYIQKQIKDGKININGVKVKASYILKLDDEIAGEIGIDSIELIQPQNIPLNILYEDDCMLVVNKPSDMLTHPTANERTETLVNALLHYTQGKLCTCNGTDRPGIVHRLDRNTSGLLMVAKDDTTYEFLKKQIQNRTIEKKYYALVGGNVVDEIGTIITNIGRQPTKPEKMAVIDSGKHSVTHYRVLERFEKYTLLDINLETGRTHQIRVHMSHIGHPIVNDTMYGCTKLPVKTNEQTLQAYSLKFISPANNEQMCIEIPMDNDIMKALNYLRSKK